MLAKITAFVKQHHSEFILGIAILCITLISFNVGRMSVSQAGVPQASSGETAGSELSGLTAKISSTATPKPKDPTVIASKASSSKLYHFTYCSGSQRIADKNKISFPNDAADRKSVV